MEIAAQLLSIVELRSQPMTLKEIADAIGFSTSKAHHYVVSLRRCRLLERERGGMRYTLGSFAIRLRLTTLSRSGTAHLVGDALRALRDDVGHSAAFSVWSDRGAVVTHVDGQGGRHVARVRCQAHPGCGWHGTVNRARELALPVKADQ